MGVNETRPVRPGEELPAERLASYLRDHVPDYPGCGADCAVFRRAFESHLPASMRRLGGGAAAPTARARTAEGT
ncbi:hypothetical protein GCM10025857_11140 [Alicyclobacillus contaminans]|nr:hypothetical protein GCM10025857_11140 [Alicyclobacillus contaminans]